MKEWLTECPSFEPRPVVFMDDRAAHAHDLCEAFRKDEAREGEILSRCTIVVLDHPGPDTEYFVADTLLKFPKLQIVAGPFETPLGTRLAEYGAASAKGRKLEGASRLESLLLRNSPLAVGALSRRFMDISDDVPKKETALVRLLDRVLRPGGILISDIEMPTLKFTAGSDDNRLLGVHAASTACRLQGEEAELTQKAARLVVVSNRTGLSTRPDKELNEHGISVVAGDILRKTIDMAESVEKAGALIRERFPWNLTMRGGNDGRLVELSVGESDAATMEARLDVVIWPLENGRFKVSGRAVGGAISIDADTARAEVLLLLATAHLARPQRSVPLGQIVEILDRLQECQTPASVIQGIQRPMNDDNKLIPRAKDGTYSFADNVKVGVIRVA